jgi:trimethylamine--corrinoid protein Co-methyltransferase
VDWQAGMESGLGAVIGALAGVNLISGPGMLDFESCQSLEKLVLDDQVAGMALRLVRGISHDSAFEAVGLIGAVVELGGFLGHRHTRENFRKELFIPGKVIERGTYDAWEAAGAKSSAEVASEEVRAILARGNPAPLPEDLRRELDEIIGAEARRLGVEGLPAA